MSAVELADPLIPARGWYIKQRYDISRFTTIGLCSFLTGTFTATSHILTVWTHLRFVDRIRCEYTNVDFRNMAAAVLAFRHTSSSQTISHRSSDSDGLDAIEPSEPIAFTQTSIFATYPSRRS